MSPLATTRFEAFSGEHLVLLAIFLAGLVVAAARGRAHRNTGTEVRVRRTAAAALAGVAVAMQAYQLTPADFDIDTSLPLALCDVATVSAVIALWTRDRRAAAFTYYVGLTLTIQGILTPSLAEGFPHPRYFGFWALHFCVVWTASYLTWGLGLTPTWRMYRFAVLATATWAVTVFCFNVVADTNYGYLNAKPGSASLLDLMGPWPWYVLVEVAVIAAAWAALLTLPWRPATRRSVERQAERI
ncbi:MAG: hypothetical protein AVDCRST_MAG34-1514 [uncultured Nocardioidaceae bacterium]|uniref:TIGR02206 family membrane protein n=1 Tax=uncultured Nocardioidaceae bacterium TaxID=253824 RepID=A0A6J4L408_9ACTN|nr:MAG: hypothetical protein AVDCRST_MAG34-1514 [uncultured Nocardioidaceae bacterium]